MTYVLWIIQALLALLFVFAGSMKLVMPLELLVGLPPLPGPFLRFIGLAELVGGLGLILPGLLRVRPGLTVLAAVELAHVMLGATAITLAMGDDPAQAGLPLVVGALLGFVAYGRMRLAAQRGRPLTRRPPAGYSAGQLISY